MNPVNNKAKVKRDPHLLQVCLMFLGCTLIYYAPAIIGLGAGITTKSTLNSLHNFYGLDFFALVFFLPVVYAAYSMGVIKAVLIALASMVVFLPYSAFIAEQPGTFFRPTAFVLILSAVGAVVAMLQRSDEQKHRSLNESKCLYEIGKTAEKNLSVEQYINTIVALISQSLNQKGEVEVSITLREKTYQEISNIKFRGKIAEAIFVGGEPAGKLELTYPSSYSWNGKSSHFVKTLAERIGSAIHSLEMEQSLKNYYEQLEVMVEARTRELEQAQEKVIRSERLAAVGELASGVGHELRNPLNVIRNCVYLINLNLEGKTNPEIEDTLRLLDLQIDISNKIVSDLLDYTRVKPPVRNIVSLHNMLQDRVAWATIPHNIKVHLDFTGESPSLFVDPEQVGRAFTNIINNAVQSISSQGELVISTGKIGKSAWIKFSDTGCGIAKREPV